MKTLNVQFIKQPGRFRLAYHEGEKAVIEEKQAREMAKEGVVEILDGNKSDESDLPEDLPGRKEIAAAGFNFEELKKISDFTEITGIGKGTAKKLIEYFEQ